MKAASRLACVALALLTAPFGAAAQQLSGRLTISGATTVSPLVAEIGKRFEKLHPNVRVDVQTGGSSRGINDAMRGIVNIGLSSRDLNATEAQKVISHALARDGIAILVHASNPIRNLDEAQIVAIYKGQIRNWKEVGGNDAPMTVVNRAGGRSELDLLTAHFKVPPSELKASIVSGENQHGIKTVAGDPNSIIYMSVGASERAAAGGEKVKLVNWNGIEASSRTVADGTLPINRPLILVTRPDLKNPIVDAFVSFARSSAVQDLVIEFSYVPLK